MKIRSSHRSLSLLVFSACVAAVTFPGNLRAMSAGSTAEYWNPGGTGGLGIWGTGPGATNWNTTAGAATGNTVWPDTGNDVVAVFWDATGGTATVFTLTPVQTAGIIQQTTNGANYVIDAETITLVQDNAAANPFIQVQSGTLSISSTLAGSNGLIKSGVGTLELTSANTYSGITSLTAGTLVLSGNGSLASTTVNIAANSSLLDSNGGLAAGTALTNAGTLTISAPDTVAGFTQTATGTLASSATLTVSGLASFGGTLQLNAFGPPAIPPFAPIHVVAAGSYAGNFTTLTENLDGAFWFNPRNGDAMRLATPQGGTLYGSTPNQTATWIALYDDVIAPDVTNVTTIAGRDPSYSITSGIADANNPDLLWSLAASFTSSGLNAALLNHLSPEVYVGLSDYAIQATRTHQRSAFSAPALEPARPTASTAGSKGGSKGGSKDAAPVIPAQLQWELFAAADYFHVESSDSQNQADYELSGFGFIAGARTNLTDKIRLAGYLGGDSGEARGSLISADSAGWTLGVIGEALLDQNTGTRLSAGVSYGRYNFNGTRSSVAASANDWAPAPAGFSEVATDSLEMSVGLERLAYHNDHFRLIPALGFHAACGSMDGFNESSRDAAGGPVALAVGKDHYTSMLADFTLRAEADLTNKIAAWGLVGLSTGIGDDPHVLAAHFVKGSREFQTTADGLSNDSWFLGLGATYKVSDSIGVALGYRVEFRSDADAQNSVSLSSTFRF